MLSFNLDLLNYGRGGSSLCMKLAEKQDTNIRTAVMLGAGGGHRLRQVTNGSRSAW